MAVSPRTFALSITTGHMEFLEKITEELPQGIASLVREVAGWGIEAGQYIGEVVNDFIDGLFAGFDNN